MAAIRILLAVIAALLAILGTIPIALLALPFWSVVSQGARRHYGQDAVARSRFLKESQDACEARRTRSEDILRSRLLVRRLDNPQGFVTLFTRDKKIEETPRVGGERRASHE